MPDPDSSPCITYDVTLDVYGLDANSAGRVMEVLALTATGLGLDGHPASVRIEQITHHHAHIDDEVQP